MQSNPLEIKKIETKKHRIWQRSFMKADIIPQHPCISVFIGSAGAGKSNLCVNMLQNPYMFGPSTEGVLPKKNKITGMEMPIKEEPYFDIVFLLIGSDDDLWDHSIDIGLIKKENVIESPTEDDIMRIIKIQQALFEKHEGDITKTPKILIICDDLANDGKLLRSKAFLHLFVKNRHLNASVWFLSQYLNLIPKACRLQAPYFFVFKFNRAEAELLAEQYCPPDIDKKSFIEMCYNVTKDIVDDEGKIIKSNNFLLICKKAPEGKRFRQNFDKYIMPEDYESEHSYEIDFEELVKDNNALRLKLHQEDEEEKHVREVKQKPKYEYLNKIRHGEPIKFIRQESKPANAVIIPLPPVKRGRKKKIINV
jgi:hypothetical protein